MHRWDRFLFAVVIVILLENVPVSTNVAWTLYKTEPYQNLNDLTSNAATYLDTLSYFFSEGAEKQPVAKVDLNVNYHAVIQLGFGAIQRFAVSVDTSFSGLWIPSADCKFSIDCLYKKTYDSKSSTDYEPDIINNVHQDKTISFGPNGWVISTNQLYGKLGFDTLLVENAFVRGQHFLEATSITFSPFHYSAVDGVFGLGFPSKQLKMAPPFYTMLDRGLMDKAVFSIYLGKPESIGEVMFGGWRSEYFAENTLHFHSMNGTRCGWSVTVNSIIMEGNEFCSENCEVLVDTGTALFVIPPSKLKSIYKSLNKIYTGYITELSCDDLWAFPMLEIKIGEQEFKFSAYEYTIKIRKSTCVLAMMAGPNENVWIFGNAFLSNIYTIFDVAQMKIGFAELNSIYANTAQSILS